jgi:hypothetical protein
MRRARPPKGPRNLKAGGFTNGLWRLEERAQSRENGVEDIPESCPDSLIDAIDKIKNEVSHK